MAGLKKLVAEQAGTASSRCKSCHMTSSVAYKCAVLWRRCRVQKSNERRHFPMNSGKK